MAEVETYVLKIEDFIRVTNPDGSIVFTHPKFNDKIELGPNESPLYFFLKIRAFSERHGVLMCHEMAKLTNGLEGDFHRGLQQFENELSSTIDRAFEDECDTEIFGGEEDDILLGFDLAKRR